jgi:hypothetical protein
LIIRWAMVSPACQRRVGWNPKAPAWGHAGGTRNTARVTPPPGRRSVMRRRNAG